MAIVGTLGDDTLVGVKGQDNLIYGDSDGQVGGSFIGGKDTLIGGANANNTLIGDAETMVGPSHGGNDILIGGKGGTNILIGDATTAGGGPPVGGDDRLVSAVNTTDDMYGDFQFPGGPGNAEFGHDTFVFGPRNGDDIIHDFHQLEDHIEIDASKAPGQFPQTFADLEPNIEVVGSDSIIHFDAHNSVTVLNVTHLTEQDFLFIV